MLRLILCGLLLLLFTNARNIQSIDIPNSGDFGLDSLGPRPDYSRLAADSELNDGQRTDLKEALNPDGTIKAGLQGSFDPKGYKMTYGPNSQPIFEPMRTMGAGDERWQTLPDYQGFYQYEGEVSAIAVSGSNVYVGGRFADVTGNPDADYFAFWNGSKWSMLGAGSVFNREVNAIAVEGLNVYVGGDFTDAAGDPNADYLAVWNGSSWSALGSGVNGPILSIAVSGSDVYVGGGFTDAGGIANADYIAVWNGSAWAAMGVGLNYYVWVITLIGSDLYAGGSFTDAGGDPSADYFAVWNGSSWSAAGPGLNGYVSAIAYGYSDIFSWGIYVGGGFTNAGGNSSADYIAEWKGGTWNALGSGLNQFVDDIVVSGSNIYVGGLFTNAGGNPNADYVAVWNGGGWAPLGPGLNGRVHGMFADNSNIYVGGDFIDAGGHNNADHFAVWNGTGWNVPSAGLNGYVNSVVVIGANVYVGGDFLDAGGNPNADNIAIWNGSSWSALGAGLNDSVYAIAINGSTVYAGGLFTDAGGNANADYIAVWSGTSWSNMGTGWASFAGITSIGILNSNVYIGGFFVNAGGNANADNIAVWNGSGWNALGQGLNGSVSVIAFNGSNIVAGGNFTDAGGNANGDFIATWNGSTWNPFGQGLNEPVSSVAVSGSRIYACGTFTDAGGNSNADRIAFWNGSTWNALGTGLNDWVKDIVVSGTNVYAGGNFTNAGGDANADNIAIWNGIAWRALGTGLNNGVNDIALTDSKVYVGGWFSGTGDNSVAANSIIQRNGVAPDISMADPTTVSPTSINLNATIKPGDLNGDYRFEWGTASGNPNTFSTSESIGSTTKNASTNISWTTPNSTIYYRIRVVNDEGTFYSEEKSYTFPAEIEVKQGNNIVASNTEYNFGNLSFQASSPDIDFTILNLGLAGLNLTGTSGSYVTKSGTHAADFAIQQGTIVSPIPYGDNRTFKVKFSPQGIGVRTASITITSDDPDEATYTINLKGTGTKINQTITFTDLPIKAKGDAPIALTASSSSALPVTFLSDNTSVATISGTQLTIVGAGTAIIKANQAGNEFYNAATEVQRTLIAYDAEPTASPTALTFKNISSSSLTVSFTAASGLPGNYLVLRRAGNPASGTPSDGTGYVVNSTIGSSQVAYVGPLTSFDDVELTQTTTYHYAVFSFNGAGATANYRLIDPLTGSQATSAVGPGQIKITEPLNHNESLTKTATEAAVTANVTDGAASKLVKLFYRAIASEGAYTLSTMTNSSGTSFSTTIPASAFDPLGVEFYIEATDASGQDKSDTYYIYRAFTSQEAEVIPSIVRHGGTEASYQIISIPFNLGSNDNIADIFEDELGAYDKKVWRLVRYQNEKNVDYKAGISKIELGKSYWFNSVADVDIKPPAGTAPHFNKSHSFSLPLQKGWNQISNPYPFAIDWDDLLGANNPTTDVVSYQIFDHDGPESFPAANSMRPYEGGFVFAKNPITLTVPVVLKNTAGGRAASTKTLPDNIDGEEWFVPIQIAQGKRVNSSVGIGMHPQAETINMDAFDDAAVPRFLEYLEGNFYHHEYFWPRFSKDVVPTDSEYEWTLKLESSAKGNFILRWNSYAIATAQSALFLFDEDHGVLVDMRTQSFVELPGADSKTVKLIYNHHGEYTPAKTFLGKPWPNPADNLVNLPLVLSDLSASYQVETEIFDLKGVNIKIIPSRDLTPGVHLIEWDATDHLSNLIPNGIYIVKAKVNGQYLAQYQKVFIQRNR